MTFSVAANLGKTLCVYCFKYMKKGAITLEFLRNLGSQVSADQKAAITKQN